MYCSGNLSRDFAIIQQITAAEKAVPGSGQKPANKNVIYQPVVVADASAPVDKVLPAAKVESGMKFAPWARPDVIEQAKLQPKEPTPAATPTNDVSKARKKIVFFS